MASTTTTIVSADHANITVTVGSRGLITALIPASVVAEAARGGYPTIMEAKTDISENTADEWGVGHDEVALLGAFIAGMEAMRQAQTWMEAMQTRQ